MLIIIIMIVFASMLFIDLVLHKFLGGTQLRSLATVIGSRLLKVLFVRLIGDAQV